MPPAARVDDHHTCPVIDPGPQPHKGGGVLAPGCVTVLIGKKPAARVMDKARCDGPPDLIVTGEDTVLVGKRPAARQGDYTLHGGRITAGEGTVLVGKDPPEVQCMIDASAAGSAFVTNVGAS